MATFLNNKQSFLMIPKQSNNLSLWPGSVSLYQQIPASYVLVDLRCIAQSIWIKSWVWLFSFVFPGNNFVITLLKSQNTPVRVPIEKAG